MCGLADLRSSVLIFSWVHCFFVTEAFQFCLCQYTFEIERKTSIRSRNCSWLITNISQGHYLYSSLSVGDLTNARNLNTWRITNIDWKSQMCVLINVFLWFQRYMNYFCSRKTLSRLNEKSCRQDESSHWYSFCGTPQLSTRICFVYIQTDHKIISFEFPFNYYLYRRCNIGLLHSSFSF